MSAQAAEIEMLIEDPGEFLAELAEKASPAASKLLLALARPHIEKKLPSPLKWTDVEPVMVLITDVTELREAASDPQAFLEKLAETGGTAGIRYLIAQSRVPLEPLLENVYNLSWDEVLPALQLIDSVEDIKRAMEDPQEFLNSLLDESLVLAGSKLEEVAVSLFIAKVKPKLMAKLEKAGASWESVHATLVASKDRMEVRQRVKELQADDINIDVDIITPRPMHSAQENS